MAGLLVLISVTDKYVFKCSMSSALKMQKTFNFRFLERKLE